MKIFIVPEVVDDLVVTFIMFCEIRKRVNIKLVLEVDCRRFIVVIQIDSKMSFKCFDQPITIIGNAASLRRERRKPGYLRKVV